MCGLFNTRAFTAVSIICIVTNPYYFADTGGKFATGVVDTGGAPLLANISANFRKKF